jgi:hypothetical protein
MAEDLDNLPPRLTDDLNDLFGRSPTIPPRADDAILNLARAELASRRRTRIIWRVTSLAAAAGIALFALQLTFHLHAPTHPTAAARLSQDLNADGRVDIIDAFYLARQIDRSQTKPQWDFNHDGAIDRRDADVIAATAVSLKGAPSQ